MLLQLENTTEDALAKLMRFAAQNNILLTLMDDETESSYLPGKPLSSQQLSMLIENSRKSGIISMQDAHNVIRQRKHAD